ncbi:MAG: C10 family peptidase [Bacteroidota bacterium]|nr:C10 family peptidase [Bacteroidota bacterium]
MLEDEIDAERPLLYSGSALLGGGHSWVIDGYNSNGQVHCNWGWDGYYNGYYSLGDFNPNNLGPFNQYESAIFNIEPTQTTGVASPQITAQSFIFDPNGYTITIPQAFGATSYEWSTSLGSITGNGTTATLFSNCPTTVSVRAYNNRCEIYSPFSTALVTINCGPIFGPSIVCSSGSTYSINNLPTGATIIWDQSYNLLTRVSPQGSNPCTFTADYSNSDGRIGAQIIVCCDTITLPDMQVRTGINNNDFSFEVWDLEGRLITTEYGLDILCSNTTYNLYVINNGECETTSYTWQIPSWWTQLDANENWIKFNTNSDPSGAVWVNAINCCGDESSLITGDFAQAYYCYNLSFTPNPAIDETTLEVLDDSGIQADLAWDVEIYDQLQILKLKTDKAKKSNFKINTSSWKDGVYIVRVNLGKEIISGKLVVQH